MYGSNSAAFASTVGDIRKKQRIDSVGVPSHGYYPPSMGVGMSGMRGGTGTLPSYLTSSSMSGAAAAASAGPMAGGTGFPPQQQTQAQFYSSMGQSGSAGAGGGGGGGGGTGGLGAQLPQSSYLYGKGAGYGVAGGR